MMLGLDTPKKQGIFGTYVMLWVSSHVLVYASKMPGARQYNTTSVVLITEAVKLVMETICILLGISPVRVRVKAAAVPDSPVVHVQVEHPEMTSRI